MKFIQWAALIGVPCVFLLAGCGQKPGGQLTDNERKVFDSAPAELKQTWEIALEASRTNDYAGAQTFFYGMLNQELSPAQREAVSKASTEVQQRLYDGVEKGDPVALKAMQDMRQNSPSRRLR